MKTRMLGLSTAASLTPFQRGVLSALPAHVKGAANVRASKRLESLGFATVRDDGCFGGDGRNIDGERWWVDITPAGEVAREFLETGWRE